MKKITPTLTLWSTEWKKDKRVLFLKTYNGQPNLKLQGLTVPLKLDASSDKNILLMSYYKKKNEKKTGDKTDKNTANIIHGKQRINYGKNGIFVERKNLLHEFCFIITSRNVQPILGKDSCDELNLIKRVNII